MPISDIGSSTAVVVATPITNTSQGTYNTQITITGPGPRRYHVASRDIFLRENKVDRHKQPSFFKIIVNSM